MPAVQFPVYNYLPGAVAVLPKSLTSVPQAENQARDAVMLGFVIAQHMDLQPAYSSDGTAPQNDDALRVDASIKRLVNAEAMPQVAAIVRLKILSALRAGDWNEFMVREVAAAGSFNNAGKFRTARKGPDMMQAIMASRAAANVVATATAPAVVTAQEEILTQPTSVLDYMTAEQPDLFGPDVDADAGQESPLPPYAPRRPAPTRMPVATSHSGGHRPQPGRRVA